MTVTDLNAWKEKGQRKWGPLANLSRVEAIFEACAHLEQAQQELNRTNVRGLIGGGSDRDIGPVIKLYKDLQASRQKEALELVPDTVVHIIAVEVENQLQKIKHAYDDQVQEEKALFENSASELSATVETLEHEQSALKQTLEEKDTRIAALDRELGEQEEVIQQLQEQLKDLDYRYNTALRKNEELTIQLVEKTKTIEVNDVKHDKALKAAEAQYKNTLEIFQTQAKEQREALTKQHDNETARLMTQMANGRSAWQKEKSAIEGKYDTLETKLQDRQKLVDTQSAEIIQLNKASLSQTEEIARLKTLAENLETLKTQLRELTAENKTLAKDNQRLSQQLPLQKELLSQISSIQTALAALQPKTPTKKSTTPKGKPKKGE